MSDSLLRRAYVRAVLEAYARLPDTPQRPRPADRRLAERLHDRGVPESLVRDALLLARARRLIRPQDAPPLAKVRSLRYFLTVIEELLEKPLPSGYARYLQRKIAAFETSPP